MQPVVLLAVAAVWAAVIIPPLLRSRVENRPNSSVTDFRRQLSTLQRAVPTRTMVPMRGMARPLTQAPQQRQAMHGHPGQVRRAQHDQHDPRDQYDRQPMQDASLRRSHGDDTSGTRAHRTMHLNRPSQREITRRRRANVVFMLLLTVAISGFLAATTHASGMVYLFALAFVSLCGYCYKLVQIRNLEMDRSYSDHTWFNAA